MRLFLLVACLLVPAAASAHAILVDSQPALHGTAPPGPATLVLRFNSRIDHARSRLALRGTPDQTLAITADSPADALTARTTLTPGAHTLRWQVLATDGHITRGEVDFTVPAP